MLLNEDKKLELLPIDMESYREKGFLILPNLLSEGEVDQISDFLKLREKHVIKKIHLEIPSVRDRKSLQAVINACVEDASLMDQYSEETCTFLRGHFDLETRLDPILHLIPRSNRVQSVLSQVFSDEALRLHMPPTARFVLPHNSLACVPAHQDISYNKHLDDFLVMWFPFTQIDEECRGILVHEGTGNLPELMPEMDRDKRFWMEGIKDQGFKKHHYQLSPGDALIFNPYTIHESYGNVSDHVRYSADFRFFPATARSEKHFLDMTTWEVLSPLT